MQPGDQLGGRYHLGEQLGQGGMSVVWRARDEVLDRDVAVKALAPALVDDPIALARVRTEALAAARLRHPSIVAVHDYGDIPAPYVVMELVDGPSLASALDTGPLPWPMAVRVVADVATALAAAHARGIVHRDVTPGNVMLTTDGAKLVDFGISAAVGEADWAPDGHVLGTPAYLAPERLDRGTVRPATDVYALGLLLYKALTGRLPWESTTTTQMLRAHRYADPAPLPAVAGLPQEVIAACHRCLAKRPEDRPTAAELAGELDRFTGAGYPAGTWIGLAGVPRRPTAALTLASPPPPSRRRRTVRFAAVGLLLLAAMIGAYSGTDPHRSGQRPAVFAAGLGSRPVECAVRYELGRHATGEFAAAITVTNQGDVPVEPWLLDFAFAGDQRVTNGTGGSWHQAGERVSVGGASLPAGASATVAFTGTYQTANPMPTEFWLNDTGCASTVTSTVTVDSPPATVQSGGSGASGGHDGRGGKGKKGKG